IAAGNEQQLRFNYARTAEETLAVFRKVGSGELLPPGEAPFRPLAPGRLLDQGVGRWFFRLDGVRRLKVQVLPQQQRVTGQTLALSPNGRRLLDAALERPGLCEFEVAPGDCGRGDFHRLELHAPQKGPAAGGPAVQVVSVIAVGPSDNEVKSVA